jgi:hypothetical protein
MTRAGTWTAVALVFALPGAAAAADEAAPRYRFTAGEKLVFVAQATTKIDISAGGRASASQMTQLIDVTWQVDRVDADGRATVTQTIDRIRFSARTTDETVEYDTAGGGRAPDNPKARALVTLLDALVGGRLSLTIDARGQFGDFKVLGPAPGGSANPSSEAGFRHLMGQLVPVLPQEAPLPGQSWAVRTEGQVHGASMSGERKYTYVGREERAGKPLDLFSLAVAMKPEAGPDAAASAAMKGSDGSGVAYLDRAAGRLVESSLTRTMALEAGEGDGKVSRKVTETITLRWVDGAR